MTNRTSPKGTSSDLSSVICWEFTRGGERLSCQVDRDRETGLFAVVLVTYRDLRSASVEIFGAAAAALRRHATLAANLRASGWKTVAYRT